MGGSCSKQVNTGRWPDLVEECEEMCMVAIGVLAIGTNVCARKRETEMESFRVFWIQGCETTVEEIKFKTLGAQDGDECEWSSWKERSNKRMSLFSLDGNQPKREAHGRKEREKSRTQEELRIR